MAQRKHKAPKTDVRRRILAFIKGRGKASIQDVAKQFRLGHEGARKQLAQMEIYGWVMREELPALPGAKGRPRTVYAVSPAGEHLFPKAYDRLSISILTAMAQEAGPDTLRKILSSLADKQVEAWRPAMEGKTAREKLQILRGLYQEDDPFMSVEERDGDLVLVERNCPFLSVAMAHPALCSLSVVTLERLLGHPVIREERFQAGNGRCVFRVQSGGKAPPTGFHLEPPPPK